jgi:hypothetical protein
LRATLTHARCDAVLEEQVVRDIRMLQHQVGMCDRADLQRMAELADENGVLARELGGAQQRSTRLAIEKSQQIERLQAQGVQMRADLIVRDTTIATLRDELAALKQAMPGPKSKLQPFCRYKSQTLHPAHDRRCVGTGRRASQWSSLSSDSARRMSTFMLLAMCASRRRSPRSHVARLAAGAHDGLRPAMTCRSSPPDEGQQQTGCCRSTLACGLTAAA